jgi:hypothetical protein
MHVADTSGAATRPQKCVRGNTVLPRPVMRRPSGTALAVAIMFLTAAACTASGAYASTGSSVRQLVRVPPPIPGKGFAGAGARRGGGYAGTSRPSSIGSLDGTGWYSRGFGGTLNPGWGYGFSPKLGGLGH